MLIITSNITKKDNISIIDINSNSIEYHHQMGFHMKKENLE